MSKLVKDLTDLIQRFGGVDAAAEAPIASGCDICLSRCSDDGTGTWGDD